MTVRGTPTQIVQEALETLTANHRRIGELERALQKLLFVHIETWAYATSRRDTLPDSSAEIAQAKMLLGQQ